MHRETLEIRLATEELWGQLAGSVSPAALTRSLGELRARLAEVFRQSSADLAEQKRELLQIRRDLGVQHEQLLRGQCELENWAAYEREQLQRRAERLRQKEQDLDRRQAQLNDEVRRWQSRELDYRDEIRRLRDKLPESGTSLAAA